MVWMLLACGTDVLEAEIEALEDQVARLEAAADDDVWEPGEDGTWIYESEEQTFQQLDCVGDETYDHTWDVESEPGGEVYFGMWRRFSDELLAWNDNYDEEWEFTYDLPVARDGTITSTCWWYDQADITGWFVETYVLVIAE